MPSDIKIIHSQQTESNNYTANLNGTVHGSETENSWRVHDASYAYDSTLPFLVVFLFSPTNSTLSTVPVPFPAGSFVLCSQVEQSCNSYVLPPKSNVPPYQSVGDSYKSRAGSLILWKKFKFQIEIIRNSHIVSPLKFDPKAAL
uniref:Uncharacterized protein n=1 Tax=Solanum tuberosum TaxID=4113 RepID=M1DWN7_SOLTU